MLLPWDPAIERSNGRLCWVRRESVCMSMRLHVILVSFCSAGQMMRSHGNRPTLGHDGLSRGRGTGRQSLWSKLEEKFGQLGHLVGFLAICSQKRSGVKVYGQIYGRRTKIFSFHFMDALYAVTFTHVNRHRRVTHNFKRSRGSPKLYRVDRILLACISLNHTVTE